MVFQALDLDLDALEAERAASEGTGHSAGFRPRAEYPALPGYALHLLTRQPEVVGYLLDCVTPAGICLADAFVPRFEPMAPMGWINLEILV